MHPSCAAVASLFAIAKPSGRNVKMQIWENVIRWPKGRNCSMGCGSYLLFRRSWMSPSLQISFSFSTFLSFSGRWKWFQIRQRFVTGNPAFREGALPWSMSSIDVYAFRHFSILCFLRKKFYSYFICSLTLTFIKRNFVSCISILYFLSRSFYPFVVYSSFICFKSSVIAQTGRSQIILCSNF